ncbi:polycomb group RING finger protein 1 isoform X3 [Hydra vulgaris]|uniref:Polycomb group RING finger protein 1 isoform X3 n=1 Tax=Hydra vulgaris TaxID=6087 RepID=A0ABM4BK36_HYDVU
MSFNVVNLLFSKVINIFVTITQNMEEKNSLKVSIKLRDLNPYLVCMLCAGYFVDATTIIECLHTFCKSCIVRHLQSSKRCPTCNIQIHETEPMSKLMLDRTMQDIIQKLIPWVFIDESRRAQDFECKLNKQVVTDLPKNDFQKLELVEPKNSYLSDEQINLCLCLKSCSDFFAEMKLEEIQHKYVRCSVRSYIHHIRHLLSKLYDVSLKDYKIQISCNGKILSDLNNLKLIYFVHWKCKSQPMVLTYTIEEKDENIVADIVERLLQYVKLYVIDSK